jgi:hypothetical protein
MTAHKGRRGWGSTEGSSHGPWASYKATPPSSSLLKSLHSRSSPLPITVMIMATTAIIENTVQWRGLQPELVHAGLGLHEQVPLPLPRHVARHRRLHLLHRQVTIMARPSTPYSPSLARPHRVIIRAAPASVIAAAERYRVAHRRLHLLHRHVTVMPRISYLVLHILLRCHR